MGAEGDVSGRTRAKSRRSFAAEVGIRKKRRRNGSMSEDETTCDSPSKPKPIKIEPIIFKDDSLTKGGSLKSSGMVLKTQREVAKERQPNVNCRVESFGRVCRLLDEKRRKWVASMGFEGLLYMADMSLPRNLCYWLFTRVDPISKIFIAPDGKEFTITPNQVGWVLGLTRGKMAVPHILRGSAMRSIAREVEEKYVVDIECVVKKTGKTIRSSCIPVTNHMLRRLEGHWEDSEKNEFKLLFLVLALNYILRPTLNGKMTYNMLVPLTCYRKAYLYDWADFVLDGLFKSVYAFSRQFYRKGYASGCAGCAIFLAIFYLDRLDRPPVSWGVWPRIKAWNMTEISNARRSDRENGKGDYGKLGCIDLVYGEDHPKSRNDPAAPTPACIDESSHDEGEGQCDSGYESPMPAETKVMKKSLTNRRCRKPVKKVINERACSGSEFNVVEDSAKGEAKGETVPKVNGDSLAFPPELFRANVQGHCSDSSNNYKRYNNHFVVENSSFLFVSDEELQEEQSPLVGGVSNPMGSNDCSEACAAVDVDYYDLLCGANSIVVPEECGSRKLSLQLLHSVVTEAEERAKLQLVRFVREKCRSRGTPGDDVVLIACGTHQASLRTCYSVIHGRRGISDEYVRVVGSLLNRMWMRNYLYSCIRYFIDPIFAMRVLQNSGASVCRSVAKTLKQRLFALPEHGVEADVSNISEVFIPVLEPLEGKQSGNHWWAVAVSLGKEKVYVIDSNTHYGCEDHMNEVDLILKALDIVLLQVDKNWSIGKLGQYEKLNLNMKLQPDIHSCGVFMLLAIFECAVHYPIKFELDDVACAREWLLALTVLVRENEVYEDVKRQIAT